MLLRAGYAVRPAAEGTQEAAALSQLFSACLSGDAALHDRLAGLVLQASATLAACRHAGTDKANRQSISDAMVRAVSALKLKVQRCLPLPVSCDRSACVLALLCWGVLLK